VDAPSTVTEAVAILREQGYIDDVDLAGTALECVRTGTTCQLPSVIVDLTYRFEGDSDPADEAIVLGLRFPESDVKAILVSAFGPSAEPDVAEFFAELRSS